MPTETAVGMIVNALAREDHSLGSTLIRGRIILFPDQYGFQRQPNLIKISPIQFSWNYLGWKSNEEGNWPPDSISCNLGDVKA